MANKLIGAAARKGQDSNTLTPDCDDQRGSLTARPLLSDLAASATVPFLLFVFPLDSEIGAFLFILRS